MIGLIGLLNIVKFDVKRLRENKGYSKYDVARLLDMSVEGYEKYEYNQAKGIKLQLLEKMCELFECEVQDIIKRD
jgi:DNA-binding Xre family transcriptional regulator